MGVPTRPKSSNGGVPRRLGVRIEDLLKTKDTETFYEILDEVRALADWTKYTKALSDLRYRVDLLAKEGVELDYNTLAEELISRDRGASAYRERFAGFTEAEKGKSRVGWAWWLPDDAFEGLGDAQAVSVVPSCRYVLQ